jgi:hypothetical protein
VIGENFSSEIARKRNDVFGREEDIAFLEAPEKRVSHGGHRGCLKVIHLRDVALRRASPKSSQRRQNEARNLLITP